MKILWTYKPYEKPYFFVTLSSIGFNYSPKSHVRCYLHIQDVIWPSFGYIHCVKYCNFTCNFLVWQFCGKAQFPHGFGRICAFPQKFRTRKLVTSISLVFWHSRKSRNRWNYSILRVIVDQNAGGVETIVSITTSDKMNPNCIRTKSGKCVWPCTKNKGFH